MRTTLDIDDHLLEALMARSPGLSKTKAIERAIDHYVNMDQAATSPTDRPETRFIGQGCRQLLVRQPSCPHPQFTGVAPLSPLTHCANHLRSSTRAVVELVDWSAA